MYSYGPLQKSLYPHFDRAWQAIRDADTDDDNSRDVRPLMAILMRMSTSPRIGGHILTRTAGLTSFGWTLEGADQNLADATKERLEEVIDQILENHAQTPMYGALLISLEWEEQPGLGIMPSIKHVYKPTELECMSTGLAMVETSANGMMTKTQVSSLTPQKFIADIDTRQQTGATMRNILYQELLRHQMLQEWGNYNKKLKGIIQGIIGNASDEEKNAVGDTLRTLTENNYTLTSKEIEFKLTEMAAKGGAESFKTIKAELEADIAIAILGQANTSQLPSGGGSRAALEVLNLIRADILSSDMKRASRLINKQLLKYDYQLNSTPNATAAPYKFKFIWDENPDTETAARCAEILLRAGVAIEENELYTKCGFTPPSDGAKTVKSPQQSNPIGVGL